MTDAFVFVILPYVSSAAAASACVVRSLLATSRSAAGVATTASDDRSAVRRGWQVALGVLAIGHLMSFVFPESMLQWNHQPIRLLLAEIAGVAAGAIGLVALLTIGVGAARASRAIRSPFDVIAWTLLLIALASGLAVALTYRWASSWSAVTVAPYVQSLLRLEPQTILVQRLPNLTRLHIFVAFVLLAVAPFTTRGQLMVEAIGAGGRWVIASACAASRRAMGGWIVQLQPLRARVMRSDGEEN
jgi:nitrate reductase gamma subunit